MHRIVNTKITLKLFMDKRLQSSYKNYYIFIYYVHT